MAEDIKILWDSGLMEGDLSFENEDLVREDGLETALIISLFTDRRAREDDILPDTDNLDKRGWWGDLASPEVEGDQIGSRLWLLERSKTEEEVLVRAKEYIKEATDWLIDDGVAEDIEIEVERQGTEGNDRLAFKVSVLKKSGTTETYKFEPVWLSQFN